MSLALGAVCFERWILYRFRKTFARSRHRDSVSRMASWFSGLGNKSFTSNAAVRAPTDYGFRSLRENWSRASAMVKRAQPSQSQTRHEGPRPSRMPTRAADRSCSGSCGGYREIRRLRCWIVQGAAGRSCCLAVRPADRCRRTHALPARSVRCSSQTPSRRYQQDWSFSRSDYRGSCRPSRVLNS